MPGVGCDSRRKINLSPFTQKIALTLSLAIAPYLTGCGAYTTSSIIPNDQIKPVLTSTQHDFYKKGKAIVADAKGGLEFEAEDWERTSLENLSDLESKRLEATTFSETNDGKETYIATIIQPRSTGNPSITRYTLIKNGNTFYAKPYEDNGNGGGGSGGGAGGSGGGSGGGGSGGSD